jgi:hypothetical protein
VPAEVDEVAWVCAQCGQGMSLDDEKGLQPLEVQYSAGIAQNSIGKPYWVVEGQVNLQRETFSGDQAKEAESFWSQPHRFFIPAYKTSLETLLAQGMSFLRQPPLLQPGPAARFDPVFLYQQDVLPAVEFIVMAVEAERKDKLKTVNFSLKLTTPCLWILPA